MHSIEEKRVYGDRGGALEAYVASSIGVVRVRIADDTVGEFGLCERCTARDVAATADAVAIATDEDVRLLALDSDRHGGPSEDASGSDATAVATGFGPAVAVGYDGSGLVAAGPDGDVSRLDLNAPGTDAVSREWTSLESDGVASVRTIDGDLLGTDDGVYRVHGGGLDHAGLTAVRDVSAAGVPLAATAEGLYKLGNGWMCVLEGEFEVVGADPRSDRGQLIRAHAASGATLYAYDADGEAWREYGGPDEPIVGIGYGTTVYAVTADGTFLSATPGDATTWRSHPLGVGDVTGLAVPCGEPTSA